MLKHVMFTLALGGSLRSISCATWSSFTYKTLAEIAEIQQHVTQKFHQNFPQKIMHVLSFEPHLSWLQIQAIGLDLEENQPKLKRPKW